MNKFLIFRTDRIGDFIFSRVLIESIKSKYPSNRIDLVCSLYNSKYIKYYNDIKNIYILDKYNISLLLKNIIKINRVNYDYLIVLDGKRRSIFFSLPLKAKRKYAVLKDFRPLTLLKIFYDNFFINSEVNSQFDNFASVVNYLNIKIPKKINYYESYNFKKNNFKILTFNFTLLHLDEKWFEGYYYNDFKYMNLNINNFEKFITVVRKKFKKNIVITTGGVKVEQLSIIKKKFFDKYDKNTYFSKKYKEKLLIIDDTDFRDLETIVSLCSEIICCEGAISHVSHALQKNTVALINNVKTAKFWTQHMERLKLIKRDNISIISKEIKNIKF